MLAESIEVLSRHVRWCLESGAALELIPGDDTGAWRTAFDQVADELRAALSWAADDARHRPQAHRLAVMLADLCFVRGLLAESQRRYEQAAELAPDDSAAAAALRDAAGAAETRHFGNEAMRLRRAAADAAVRAGDRAGAAADLAQVGRVDQPRAGADGDGRAARRRGGADRRGAIACGRRPGR